MRRYRTILWIAGESDEDLKRDEQTLDRPAFLSPLVDSFHDPFYLRRCSGKGGEDLGRCFPARHDDLSWKRFDPAGRLGTEEVPKVTEQYNQSERIVGAISTALFLSGIPRHPDSCLSTSFRSSDSRDD